MNREDVVKYIIEGAAVAGIIAFVVATAGGGAPIAAAEVVADVSGEAVAGVSLREASTTAVEAAIEQASPLYSNISRQLTRRCKQI